MHEPVSIKPDAVYDDGTLHLALGLTPSTLAKARRSGDLRFNRQGKRTLYLGQWVLDWLRDSAQAANDQQGCPMNDTPPTSSKPARAGEGSLNTGEYRLDCFDKFTSKFIRSKVHKLIGRAGFTDSDRYDLLQEFALDLIRRCANFDPNTASWDAFVVVVCENRYTTILEHRHAEMRSRQREAGSLNQLIRDSKGKRAELGSTIPDVQQARHTGRHRRSHEDVWDLDRDVNQTLDQMPRKMRQLCEIIKHKSKAAAARELGIPQGELYSILGRVLARFEKASLRDYLA